MILYGSLTSPFVRRVRVVADELGVSYSWVDAMSDEGQAELRRRTPIWKIPVVEVDGRVLWDSATILDWLFEAKGFGPLRRPKGAQHFDEQNFKIAVDEALLSLIRLFYLRRDHVDADAIPFMRKEQERAVSILSFIEGRLRGPWCTAEDGFGLAELYLVTALDWMSFRGMFDVQARPAFVSFLQAHAHRKSLATTTPPAPV